MDSNIKVTFSAIDPYVESNIITPNEKEVKGQGWVQYGDKNIYPNYLYDLYSNCTTLKTLIDTCTSYICGDNVTSNNSIMTDLEAIRLVRAIAFDLLICGGTNINVLRNRVGDVCRLYPIDFRNIRTDKKRETFYYSEDFGSKSYGRCKYTVYPKYESGDKDIPSSVYSYSNSIFSVYPVPVYASATKDCEIEKLIAEYHLNNIRNNFSSNYMVCFNNGVPTDEVKEEIEEAFDEKYTGVENAGRPIIAYSADKDHAPEILKLDSDDWGEKYKSLKEDSRQNIFTAFRCTPNLVGIATQTTGFNSQEYGDAFRLFNRTVIQPYQKTICMILDEILGTKDSITIEPYTIDFEDGEEDVEEITSTETK